MVDQMLQSKHIASASGGTDGAPWEAPRANAEVSIPCVQSFVVVSSPFILGSPIQWWISRSTRTRLFIRCVHSWGRLSKEMRMKAEVPRWLSALKGLSSRILSGHPYQEFCRGQGCECSPRCWEIWVGVWGMVCSCRVCASRCVLLSRYWEVGVGGVFCVEWIPSGEAGKYGVIS